jgi:multidrug efflux system membrane fusion protein
MRLRPFPAVLIFIPLLSILSLAACRSRTKPAAGPPPSVPVTVATASTQETPLEVRVVGAVEPSAKVEVKSQVAGQLLKTYFTEGQDLKQGDLLLEIDPQPYREALRQAEAAVERDRAQIAQSEFALQKDIVQSKAADADATRYANLAKDRLVSEQQELQYRSTAESLKQAMLGDQAAIAGARGSLNVDEAAVSQAKLNLSYCKILAPMSGRTGNLLVNAGNLVKVNDVALVVINRITPVFVSFNVPEKHLETIRRYSATRSLPVEVTLRGNPAVKATGHLSVIDNTVDTQTGTIRLKAVFDNTNRLLWPGQFVDVVLTLSVTQQATVIPSEAVQAGQKGQFVYVVKADKSVEPRVVTVGRNLENKVIVENGISPGETVVTDGQMLLFPGAHVMIAAAPKADIGVQ